MASIVAFNKRVFTYSINELERLLKPPSIISTVDIGISISDSDCYRVIFLYGFRGYNYVNRDVAYCIPLQRSNYLSTDNETRYLSRNELCALISAYITKYNKYKVPILLLLNKTNRFPLSVLHNRSNKRDWLIHFCYILIKAKYISTALNYNLTNCSMNKLMMCCVNIYCRKKRF